MVIVAIISSVGCSNANGVGERSSVGEAIAPVAGSMSSPRNSESTEADDPQKRTLPASTGVDYFGTSGDLTRLGALWTNRTVAKPFADFPIGPGDEIDISVPGVDELTDTVRVSVTGTIHLAYIGEIQGSGLTEDELRKELENRLRKYMHVPDFKMNVKEYRTRYVAVLGAVKNPGVFSLSGPSETILQLLSLAGGALQDGAADRVILIPALPSTGTPDPGVMMAAGQMTGDEPFDGKSAALARVSDDGPPLTPFRGSNGPPLVISMRNNSENSSARYLNMPLRPGDVVVVPNGGEVAVVGWVYNPGHFKITSGLTATAAIGAAGGLMYAADQNDVELFRVGNDGTTESTILDLEKIKSRQELDPVVQGNDVIEAGYSKAKILPYVMYSILNSKIGVAMPAP